MKSMKVNIRDRGDRESNVVKRYKKVKCNLNKYTKLFKENLSVLENNKLADVLL